MSEAKHTPGPWEANCFMVVATGERHHGLYGGLEICHTGLVGRNKPPQQAEADARLIAASPDYHDVAGETADFLASLADTLDRWANESRSGGWSTHQVDANQDEANNCRRMAAKVRKVIAKATGDTVKVNQ